MEIARFGIRLVPIGDADLEQVRTWRNLPQIREQMVFRDLITPEMQRAWFAALDKAKNLYWIIEAAGARVGVIHLKDIDLELKSAEWGIYIVDEERGAMAVLKSAIALFDVAFDELGLERIRATVLPTNDRAIRMNVALGMSAVESTTTALQYEVTPERYRAARPRFRAVLR
ncbi:MAG: hypothetical protein BGO98_36710 [Myxococcales bacterium 68-20]|nr:GNAT family N-acetyltransferase [Myxococcales bacterium]OJY26115.1 MAG: hypothetical protein BGO98_36710 [Myxococcales bacterium 68-20]